MIDIKKTGLTGGDKGHEYDDTYDYMDCRPGLTYPASQIDNVTPDYIKKMIEERAKKKEAEQVPPKKDGTI